MEYNALVRNHIQPSGVLYVVTAPVHYTPYSPGRGGLTITYITVSPTGQTCLYWRVITQCLLLVRPVCTGV